MPTGSKPDVLGNDLGSVPSLPHLQPHKDFACVLNVDIIQEYFNKEYRHSKEFQISDSDQTG